MGIGERLAELRKDHGLKQKDVAKILNVAVSTVSNYETDSHEPDLTNLCRLADLLGVSTDFILGRTDIPTNINTLKDSIHPDLTKGDVLEIMEHLNKEDCDYLAKTIHMLYHSYRHESSDSKKNRSKE